MSEHTPAHEVVELLYALRDQAATTADALRPRVREAQELLDKLDRIADQAQDAACLVDASALGDRDFGQAFIPESTGMRRPDRPHDGLNPETEADK